MTVTESNTKEPLLTQEIIDSINTQVIFWSDDRCEHWFFDYSLDGVWISSTSINNELTECEVVLWKE